MTVFFTIQRSKEKRKCFILCSWFSTSCYNYLRKAVDLVVVTDADWLLYAISDTQATSKMQQDPPPNSNLTVLKYVYRAGTTKLSHSCRTQIKAGPSSLSRPLHLPAQQLLKQRNYEGRGFARTVLAAWHLSHQQQCLSTLGWGTPSRDYPTTGC